jgi:hypothetical protein
VQINDNKVETIIDCIAKNFKNLMANQKIYNDLKQKGISNLESDEGLGLQLLKCPEKFMTEKSRGIY